MMKSSSARRHLLERRRFSITFRLNSNGDNASPSASFHKKQGSSKSNNTKTRQPILRRASTDLLFGDRRYSDEDSPSTSVQNKRSTYTKTRRPILRRASTSLRWSIRKPPTNATSEDYDEDAMAIDPRTTAYAIDEAKIAAMTIRDELPNSLLEASDCIALHFKRER